MSCIVVALGTALLGPARGPERVAALRDEARSTLLDSARATGARLGALEKDEREAPLPSLGWHWSLSHAAVGDEARVAAAVWRARVGVDIEPVRTRRGQLVASVLDGDELALLGPHIEGTAHAFTRAWTAKEAVLKKLGVGLAALSRTRITALLSADELVVTVDDSRHHVHQTRLLDSICSVSFDPDPDVAGAATVRWLPRTHAARRGVV